MTTNITVILICFLFFFSHYTFAQLKPVILPEQMETASTLQLRCYCKPGIQNKSRSRGLELTYHYLAGSTLQGIPEQPLQGTLGETNRLTNFIFKIKAPILLKPDLKILAGYSYVQQNYNFQNIGDNHELIYNVLNDATFKSNTFNIYLTKSLDAKHYIAFRSRLLFNGSYDGLVSFKERYRHYNLIGALGFKPNDDFEWGVGILFSHTLEGRNRLLPFVFLNKNFTEKWGLEATPPASVFVRYNYNPSNILLLGMEYASQAFAISPESLPPIGLENNFVLDHSEARLTFSWERKFVPWVWINVKVGYQFNFFTEVVDVGVSANNIAVDPTNAPFVRLSFFLSPPDKMMK